VGTTRSYDDQDATITVTAVPPGPQPPHVRVRVVGPERWSGWFGGTWTMTQLEPGFYDDIDRFPFENPTEGGVDWSGEGRGCNSLDGWMAVDEISYGTDGRLDRLRLRWQQRCGSRYEGYDPPLRGRIDYTRPTDPPTP
jgi:hypothetical protein